jgi:hypothetical protein
MSSLKNLFGKKHAYETQDDLARLTPEQIIRLSPSDVSSKVDTRGSPLQGVKRRAMYRLLAIKRMEKESPSPEARENAIRQFLVAEGLQSNAAVEGLIHSAYKDVMSERVEQKTLENRLRQLQDKPIVPLTSEEEDYRRVHRLTSGGKRRRTKTRRHKKRKGRSSRRRRGSK